MEYVAPILQAIASLAWAGFAFAALFTFRPEIVRALGRLRKGEIFGQRFELGEDLVRLESSATAATKEVEQLPLQQNRIVTGEEGDRLDATIRAILQQGAIAPKIALMTLSAELEKQARHALATRGLLLGRPAVSLNQALNELHQYGFPPNLFGSLKLFDEVRNKIIHGANATDDDVLKALDSGVTILRALNALPNEVNVVYRAGVEIFSDPACTQPIANATAVILETTSPGGVMKTHRIYPTTRTHFQKGKQVAWEWNDCKAWGAAWYRDPDTGVIKEAWGSSMEFVGRHLDDI